MSVYIIWADSEKNQPLFSDLPSRYLPNNLKHQLKKLEDSKNLNLLQNLHNKKLVLFLLWQFFLIHNIPPDTLLHISKLPNGRPIIKDSSIDYNASHSNKFVAIIINLNYKNIISNSGISIDIEYPINRKRNYAKIINYYANQEEINYFKDHINSEYAFYQSWCIREAILKSQGIGVSRLSSVYHNPITKIINSRYCKQGRLFFTDKLPFYLAFFIPSALQDKNNIQILEFKNNKFQPTPCNHYITYKVN